MDPLISIIVPIYNAEKTLKRCIDSIVNQSFKSWELLLVNDGSTDHSGEICNEYALKDSRVRFFCKENGGVSSARNVGLDNVKSEWITFIDADDQLPEDAFDLDFLTFREDLVIGAHYVLANEKTSYSRLDYGLYKDTELSGLYSQKLDFPTFGVVWGKLLKSSKCKGLYFDANMIIGEDTLFMMQYLQRIESCRIIEKFIYIYNVPENFVFKYSLDIKSSIYCLNEIYNSYKKLGIRSKSFERRIFLDYKLFCQMNIYSNVKLWYNDIRVNKIYNQIKDAFPLKYRILYSLMSYPNISRFVNMFRRS